MKKWIKRLFIGLLSIFLVLSIIPYLIPVEEEAQFSQEKPFLESEFKEVEGVYLHYRRFSPEIETPKGKILFVHGLGGSTFSWRENMTFFKEAGYLVLAVDLPGFGYSTKISGTNHSQESRSLLLWSLLDQVDATFDKPTDSLPWALVGHSMGGGTVTAMTKDRPEQTKNLILVDGAVFDNQPGFATQLLKYPPLARGIKILFERVLLKRNRIEDFLTSAYGRLASPEEIDGYLEPLQMPGTSNVALDLVKTAKNVSIETLKTNQVPILALWGQEDTWVPLSQAEKIQELIPRTELTVISGAYHCPMETHADLFNETLLQFLESP